MEKNLVKCRYSHCKSNEHLIPREKAVKSGNAYYHPECLKEKEQIAEIVKYYIDNFEKDPVMSFLRKTINTLIFDRKYPADYVLYALKYAKQHGIPLQHVGGIYYVVKNNATIREYKHAKAVSAVKEIDNVQPETGNAYAPTEGYSDQGKSKGFGGILK